MRILTATPAIFAAAALPAAAWDSNGPTSTGNPLAGIPWFVDEQ
jgi:hypothetical protein